MSAPAPGQAVGAQRWPYSSAHPDCWAQPWRGRVLPMDSPLAWTGCIAFPTRPTRAQVRAHLERLRELGLPADDKVPVLWDFGSHQKVYWERAESLRPYAEDVRQWREAREAARAGTHQRAA